MGRRDRNGLEEVNGAVWGRKIYVILSAIKIKKIKFKKTTVTNNKKNNPLS